MSDFKLNEQQEEAVEFAVERINKGVKLTRVGGFAGVGKTVVSKFIYDRVPSGVPSSFCGKACDVLRKKGLPAQTIHSLIYEYDKDSDSFWLKSALPCNWIHVDEGSMVGSSLWSDLVGFDIPILVTGDPGQLEPIDDNDPHLMRDPDFTLDTIHRQAFDNPIIKLATEVRIGDDVNWRPFERPKHQIYDEFL